MCIEQLLQPMRKIFLSIVATSILFPLALLADNPTYDINIGILHLPMVEVPEDSGNEKSCYEAELNLISTVPTFTFSLSSISPQHNCGDGSSKSLPTETTTENILAAGTVFREPMQEEGNFGPQMVQIPAGSFRMGDINESGNKNEQPVHEVSIESFAMSRYEVTLAEFRVFVDATGYQTEAETGDGCWIKAFKNGEDWWEQLSETNWRNPPFFQDDNHPVVCMSMNDGAAYARWLTEQTGHTYRLATEAEWEYAARGGTETRYWWGNTASHENSNYGEDIDCCRSKADGRDAWGFTGPVGSFEANPFGLYDMSGNIREWVCSAYSSKYEGQEQQCTDGADNYILRGGAWNYNAKMVRPAFRDFGKPEESYTCGGIRVVRK